MRFAAVVAIWLVIVGGLALVQTARRARRPAPARPVSLKTAAGRYALEIIPTGPLAPDGFAVRGDDGGGPAALVVRRGGQTLFARAETVASGETLRVEPLDGIVEGVNELWITGAPARETVSAPAALRVRLMRDAAVVAERIFWAEDGAFRGAFEFTIPSSAKEP